MLQMWAPSASLPLPGVCFPEEATIFLPSNGKVGDFAGGGMGPEVVQRKRGTLTALTHTLSGFHLGHRATSGVVPAFTLRVPWLDLGLSFSAALAAGADKWGFILQDSLRLLLGGL